MSTPKAAEHTPGAMRAAKIIVSGFRTDMLSWDEGSREGIAKIIDREFPGYIEMREALEAAFDSGAMAHSLTDCIKDERGVCDMCEAQKLVETVLQKVRGGK